jgi:benzoate membrane transport protein
VLLTGLAAAGATPAEAASGLLALCALNGVASILVSWRTRLPIAFVWSTPGAALLVAAHRTGDVFGVAVAAFLVSALLVAVTGAVPALGRLLERIPPALSGALLAGILLPFCLAPVTASAAQPLLALPLVVVWFVLHRFAPRFAGAVVILLAIGLALATGGGGTSLAVRGLVLTPPVLDPAAVLTLAVPLWVVTMAGQNLPGLGVLRANDYAPPTRALLVLSGAASAVAAPFGGNSVNLAAITGAIVVGPDASADRSRRWIAGAASGCAYLLLGAIAGPAAALVGDHPPVLIEAAAGLALIGAFVGGLTSALEAPGTRLAAAVTFLVVASGVEVLGIGSAFWGLVAGAAALLLLQRRP